MYLENIRERITLYEKQSTKATAVAAVHQSNSLLNANNGIKPYDHKHHHKGAKGGGRAKGGGGGVGAYPYTKNCVGDDDDYYCNKNIYDENEDENDDDDDNDNDNGDGDGDGDGDDDIDYSNYDYLYDEPKQHSITVKAPVFIDFTLDDDCLGKVLPAHPINPLYPVSSVGLTVAKAVPVIPSSSSSSSSTSSSSSSSSTSSSSSSSSSGRSDFASSFYSSKASKHGNRSAPPSKRFLPITYLTQSPLNTPLPLEGGEALMLYMRHIVQKVCTYVHIQKL